MKIILLAGGAGKRLFPLTRLTPKPFIPLIKGKSLFQITVQRYLDHGFGENLVCTTPQEQVSFVRKQLAPFPVPQKILLEPSLRNTGPATLWAVRSLLEKNEIEEGDRCLLVPCDQILEDEGAFFVQLKTALLKEVRLRIFGMRVEQFDPSFGYFIGDGERVLQFMEKPSVRPSHKNLYCNSGLLLFTPKLLMQDFPIAKEFFAGNISYEALPKLSIDQMVLDGCKRLFYQSLGTSFIDLGTLGRLHHFLGKDPVNGYCGNQEKSAVG